MGGYVGSALLKYVPSNLGLGVWGAVLTWFSVPSGTKVAVLLRLGVDRASIYKAVETGVI